MKSLPTENGIVFLICDDLRQEQGGKTTLLGVYGDTVMVEEPAGGTPGGEPILPSIACYFAFSDGEGEWVGELQVIGPDGKELLPPGATQPMVKKEAGWMAVAFKIMPFKALPGTYSVLIRLDGKEYVRKFNVQMASAKH